MTTSHSNLKHLLEQAAMINYTPKTVSLNSLLEKSRKVSGIEDTVHNFYDY